MSSKRSSTRAIAGATVFLLLAAACSSSDAQSPATTVASTAPRTTPRPSTTTTSSTTTIPTTTEPATTTTTEPATTTTVPGPPVYPLLGVPLPDPNMVLPPALVVKIDNAPGARPQTGFNAADIAVEEIVNDSLTRFALIFNSQGSNPVGPIRSGRLQDIDLFGMLHHPLFAWSGGNRTVTNAIDNSDLVNLGPNHAQGYFRTRDRRAPHNLYNTTDALWAQAPADSGPPPQLFQYRGPADPLPGEPAAGADLRLDGVSVSWRWDPASSAYYREMLGRPHIDAGDGQQVSTNNVVVLAMEYAPGISGSPDAQSLGWNEAFVFTGGNVVHGVWSRDDRLNSFALADDNGNPITLTPGRTFIELPREGTTTIVP